MTCLVVYKILQCVTQADALINFSIMNDTLPTVTLKLVPAVPEHFGDGGRLKYGVLYFLKSAATGKMDQRPYTTGDHTNVEDFRTFFRKGLVYEAVSEKDAVLFDYGETEIM